jgi:hypothetical protein
MKRSGLHHGWLNKPNFLVTLFPQVWLKEKRNAMLKISSNDSEYLSLKRGKMKKINQNLSSTKQDSPGKVPQSE